MRLANTLGANDSLRVVEDKAVLAGRILGLRFRHGRDDVAGVGLSVHILAAKE